MLNPVPRSVLAPGGVPRLPFHRPGAPRVEALLNEHGRLKASGRFHFSLHHMPTVETPASTAPNVSAPDRPVVHLERRLATTLMVVARITTPKRYDSTAWRRAVLRIALELISVSETWKVMPRVNAM